MVRIRASSHCGAARPRLRWGRWSPRSPRTDRAGRVWLHGAVRRRVTLSRVVVAGGSGASAWTGFCTPRPPVREPRAVSCLGRRRLSRARFAASFGAAAHSSPIFVLSRPAQGHSEVARTGLGLRRPRRALLFVGGRQELIAPDCGTRRRSALVSHVPASSPSVRRCISRCGGSFLGRRRYRRKALWEPRRIERPLQSPPPSPRSPCRLCFSRCGDAGRGRRVLLLGSRSRTAATPTHLARVALAAPRAAHL